MYAEVQKKAFSIAANGRLPATLPERIRRACVKYFRRFASEGNVVARSERYASEAKPDESRPFLRIKPVKTRSAGRLVM